MRLRVIHRYIGLALMMVAALMVVSGMISLVCDRDGSAIPLFFSAFVTSLFGCFPLIFVKPEKKISQKEGYWIVVGIWFFACVFGMLPYLMYGGEFNVVNALFESVSGFTTTGASTLTNIEALPRGIMFWRMATSWVGGIGIVTMFSLLISNVNGSRSMLAGSEISGIAREPFKWKIGNFANRIIITYVGLTLLSTLGLKLCGLGWFDSLTHSMSACATCGFGNLNNSFAGFNNVWADIVLTIIMVLAGMNFSLIFISFTKGNHFRILKSEVHRAFLGVFFISTILVTLNLFVNCEGFWKALRLAAFQIASVSTTTGFATADTTTWPPLSIGIIICCSFIFGCSGSTSGGIKMDRALLAFKGVVNKVKTFSRPRKINSIRIDGMLKTPDQVGQAMLLIIIYFAIVAICGLIATCFGVDPITAFTGSIACMGNLGPGFGEVGSMGTYAHLPMVVKFVFSIEMLVGRLEIFPLLYVISSLFGTKR